MNKIYYTQRNTIAPYNIITFYNKNNFNIRFNGSIFGKSIRCIHDNSQNINSNYTKVKFKEIYFSPQDFFDQLEFNNKLTLSLDFTSRYALMFRVCYGDSSTYKMLGRQYGLAITDYTKNQDTLASLHNLLVTRLAVSMDEYNYIDNTISTIQIIAYKVKYSEQVTKLYSNRYNIDSLGHNIDLIDTPRNHVNLVDHKILPLTMDLNKYETQLNLVIDEDSQTINHITLNNKDFLEAVNQQRFGDEFIVRRDSIIYLSKNKKYVTIIYVDVTVDNRLMHKINVFTVDGGHIFDATDIYLTPNTFSRTINNVTKIIDTKNRSVVSSSIVVKLTHVRCKKTGDNKYDTADPFIGTLDLETYKSDGISKVYAIGFHTKNNTKCYYIDQNTLDSNELIMRCLEDLISRKYHKYTFYVHNLGRFDVYFLLGLLIKSDKYDVKLSCHGSHILSMLITGTPKDVEGKNAKVKYHIKLVDSYNILKGSLDDLCTTYQTKTVKGVFPYDFITGDKLFYKGIKPAMSFYKRNVSLELYNNEPLLWDTQLVTLDYLKRDLVSLYEIMSKFSEEIYVRHSTYVTDSSTITSIALKVYLNRFYNNNIPLINNRSIYEDIKESYYGGITEVYKPYGENLYYYDVNSLYPYVALQPMPGLKCTFLSDINKPIDSLPNIFGFYYCKVETTDFQLGLLPYRSKTGLLMPNGSWEGWYFSEELKFASLNGYKINIVKGYEFNKEYDVFKSYVDYIYDIKMNTKDSTTRAVAKSMLNNLLGRFGLDINESKSDIVNEDTFNMLLQTKEVLNFHTFDNFVLVNYKDSVNKEICNSMNVDHKKAVLHNLISNKNKEVKFSDVSIVISSAVTSYARIEMSKAKLEVIKKGGVLYYTDTDSLVIDTPLQADLVGTKLGQFKLEHEVLRGYFISGKTYCLFNKSASGKNKSRLVIKAKGVDSSRLKELDFRKLLRGEDIKSKITTSKRDFQKGYVNIIDSSVGIFSDAYVKREKIMKNGLWKGTKPLIISSIDEGKNIKQTPINIKSVKNVNSVESRRSYSTVRKIISNKNISLIENKKVVIPRHEVIKRKIIKRAMGNFLKGVLILRGNSINFKDYTILQNFILNYDNSLKISAQSISNIKRRNASYKPLDRSTDVINFLNYIKSAFPDYKDEWLFIKPINYNITKTTKPKENTSLVFKDSVNKGSVSNIKMSRKSDGYTSNIKFNFIFNTFNIIEKTTNVIKNKIVNFKEETLNLYEIHEGGLIIKTIYSYCLLAFTTGLLLAEYVPTLNDDTMLEDFKQDNTENTSMWWDEYYEYDWFGVEFDRDEFDVMGLEMPFEDFYASDIFDMNKDIVFLPKVIDSNISSKINSYPSMFQPVTQLINNNIVSVNTNNPDSRIIMEVKIKESEILNTINRDIKFKRQPSMLEKPGLPTMSKKIYFDMLKVNTNFFIYPEVIVPNIGDYSIYPEKVVPYIGVDTELESKGSYTPLTPTTYNELVKEYRNNSLKIKTFENNLDNGVLTEAEYKEYEDLLAQQSYLIQQRISNYDSRLAYYDKEIEKSVILKNKLLLLEAMNGGDPDKVNIRIDMRQAYDFSTNRINKLTLEKEILRRKFVSESFIGEPESIITKGWDKGLSKNEIRYINTLGLDNGNAIKERLALDNRKASNQMNFNYNEGYTKAIVRVAKEVAFELQEDISKVKRDKEVELIVKEENRLTIEISELEAELAALEAKEIQTNNSAIEDKVEEVKSGNPETSKAKDSKCSIS